MLSLISLVLFIAVLSSTHAIHEGRLLSQHRALGRRASHQLHDLARPVEPIKRVPQQRCRSRPSQKSSPPVADIGTDNPGLFPFTSRTIQLKAISREARACIYDINDYSSSSPQI